jgi:hypothetical protein
VTPRTASALQMAAPMPPEAPVTSMLVMIQDSDTSRMLRACNHRHVDFQSGTEIEASH